MYIKFAVSWCSFVWVHGCVAGYKAFEDVIVEFRCVYLYFRRAMEKHLAFLRKHCRLCAKSVKRNVDLILFVHLLLYFHTKLSTKLSTKFRNSCDRGLVQSVCKSEFSLFYGSWHSSQATAMFLAFLQDFIAYECIEGDRLISTSVTCKFEC